ncbi:HNH endonuclease [Arthrobacter sp. MMS18-M83]|uniref:HNH endonuclease n=1 Tax=Arthrobacter sp. MMS18-M83 TaxID=2996261 RepID=UPI00227B8CC2|nr:HNH endonuclease [Arthrobacter sp. MMS18-M83]WAH97791.1 HNH endonuclease [Arthrobacter sp. MMS18-M83]
MMIKNGIEVRCGICGKPILHKKSDPSGRLSVDHIVPESWCGSDDAKNLQPSHVRCNAVKGNNTDRVIERA